VSEPLLLPGGRVLRYSFRERLMHWVAGFSYLYLMVTGLAFWSPWFYWLAIILGGATLSREVHPWVGLVFQLAVLWMGATWSAQMRSTAADRAWWHSLRHYIRNEESVVPDQGRFNGGQKALFWGFFFCALLLTLSGLILWYTELIPWNLRALRQIAVLVHAVSALMTIALFMIHVYMGLAVERGAFGSVIRGDVSRAWAKAYHKLWYDQVAGDPAAKK
jgi:formate dehydrogenase subunit gamma